MDLECGSPRVRFSEAWRASKLQASASPKHVEAEALMELDSCDYESLSAGNCPQRFSNQYRHFSLV